MRITFERTGGLAGLRISKTVDTESLPGPDREGLEKTVEVSGFFDLPPVLKAAGAEGNDRFQFRITIDKGDRQHTVQLSEAAMPERLRPLLDRLRELATAR
jgi:hypothetical protein